MPRTPQSRFATCQCRQTAIALTGEPIQSVTCYCESCRTAALGFEREPGAPRVVRPDGGVDYCLYRKDRVAIAQGADALRDHRLKPTSPTRRVVASCCGSPMFVDFTPGHWLTVFADRLPAPAPAPQMGVMTRDRPAGAPPPDVQPAHAGQPPAIMIKLLAAWAAMGFRRPKIAW